MKETIRKYLTYYFHDSSFTDAHFDRETSTLTLTLQCDRELDCPENWKDEKYTYRLIFEGVQYQLLETGCRDIWTDMQFLVGELLDSARKKEEEENIGEPLIHYGIHLSGGWAEILCRDIRIERAEGELTDIPEKTKKEADFSPMTPGERNRLLTTLTYGGSLGVMPMMRLRRTLEQMHAEKDEELPALLRRILALPGRILLSTTAGILSECGTKDDLPLLYAHLPETKTRPDLRRALLDAIDALAEKE